MKIFCPDTSEFDFIQGHSDLVRKSGALILKWWTKGTLDIWEARLSVVQIILPHMLWKWVLIKSFEEVNKGWLLVLLVYWWTNMFGNSEVIRQPDRRKLHGGGVALTDACSSCLNRMDCTSGCLQLYHTTWHNLFVSLPPTPWLSTPHLFWVWLCSCDTDFIIQIWVESPLPAKKCFAEMWLLSRRLFFSHLVLLFRPFDLISASAVLFVLLLVPRILLLFWSLKPFLQL